MIKTSVIALLSAAVFVAAAAIAQDVSVDVSTSASGEVSVSTPDVSSTLSSVSSELSSAVSSVSSEVSSQLSSVSSSLSSELSSSESGMMSSEPMMMNCGNGAEDLDVTMLAYGALDEASLAGVTSVTIVTIGECEGLSTIDGSAQATLGAHPALVAALAAAGESGSEIVAYTLSDGSLTVYVRAS